MELKTAPPLPRPLFSLNSSPSGLVCFGPYFRRFPPKFVVRFCHFWWAWPSFKGVAGCEKGRQRCPAPSHAPLVLDALDLH